MQNGYRDLLDRADSHFRSVLERQPGNLECRVGCTMCCHGLFEIGAADVVVIADALSSLDPEQRTALVARALEVVEETDHPTLQDLTPEAREQFFERADAIPCPALDDAGRCSIYEGRPMVCRTFGLPIREGARYIGEECELNFREASREEKESAAWDLLGEDVVGPDDLYTIPQAILLADRMARARSGS